MKKKYNRELAVGSENPTAFSFETEEGTIQIEGTDVLTAGDIFGSFVVENNLTLIKYKEGGD